MGIVVRRDIVTRRVSGCDPKGREGCEVANTGIDGKGGWIKVGWEEGRTGYPNRKANIADRNGSRKEGTRD